MFAVFTQFIIYGSSFLSLVDLVTCALETGSVVLICTGCSGWIIDMILILRPGALLKHLHPADLFYHKIPPPTTTYQQIE